jgi:hypothetical protein
MEIKVNIPANDYVQPTEVRQEIVQSICNAIIKNIDKPKDSKIYVRQAQSLFIDPEKGHIMRGNNIYVGELRIRSVEMKAAFEAIQDAGYFIFHSVYPPDNTHSYTFQKKPYNEYGRINRIDFDLFID